MSDAVHAGADAVPLADIPGVDRVCDAFDAAWRDGPRPRVEDYAGPQAGPLLCELICIDVEYRRAAGERPAAADYAARFPGLDADWLAAVVAAPAAPRRLGRFELLELVGRGGCGAVWRAHDPALGRVVAVKLPHPALVDSPAALERFRREARTVARLRHDGIVAVHEVAEVDGTPVLVQDFVEGESLRDRLARGRPSPREAADLARQVAEALDYAHRAGAVHRDVKPANVVVTPDGRAVLIDFGLAAEGDAFTLTADGQLLGTPAYMPPEQAAGTPGRADARSDVYSLGVVLYEMLAGGPPFRDASASRLLDRVISEDPPAPRSRAAGVPRDLEAVCLKAMAKEPAGRYATAGALADDLRRFLAGEPVRARPPGRAAAALRWVRRHPARAALAAAAAVTALSLAGAAVAWGYNAELQAAYRELDRLRRAEAGQHRRAEEAYYLQRVSLASREWGNGNVGRVVELLRECPERIRGWEWRYLTALTRRGLAAFPNRGPGGEELPVLDVAYSPDGAALLTSDLKGVVRVREAGTGRVLREVRVSDWPVLSCAWRPDGRRFAAADVMGRVVVWDAATGGVAREFAVPERSVYRLAFDPAGRRLAAAGGDGPWEASERSQRPGVVRAWDADTGRELLALGGFEQAVTGVAFDPAGRRLAVAEGATTSFGARHRPGRVAVYDADSGRRLWAATGHDGPLTAVAYSPDGARLVTAGWDRSLVVWDPDGGGVRQALAGGHRDWVRALAFGPDGRTLASAGADAKVVLWDVRTGKPLRTYRGHTQAVSGVSFRPDGKRLASCGGDRCVRVWDATADQEATVLPEDGPVSAVAFHPGGRRLFTAGYAPGRGGEPRPAVTAWDPDAGAALARAEGHTHRVLGLDVSWDGRRVFSCGRDRTARAWDYACDPDRLTPAGVSDKHPGPVTGVAAHPRAGPLATSSIRYVTAFENYDEVRLWDVDGGGEPARLSADSPGPANAVAYSPDGFLVAAALTGGRAVVVRDAATRRELARLPQVRTVLCLAFSRDGRWLASGGQDYEAVVWDAAALRGGTPPGQPAARLRGHTRGVFAVAFSPDGSRVATGSEDANVKLWDAATGREVLTLTGHTDAVTGVAFSPDGQALASSSNDGTVRVWRAGGYGQEPAAAAPPP